MPTEIIDFLTTSHIESNGGYPYDFAFIGDKFVVAELEGDKTVLGIYAIDKLIHWYLRAEKIHTDDNDLSWNECFIETMES